MTLHRLPFESVFADESGGNIKTPQGEYLAEGEFPIVDQGKALIGGYTNHRDRICGEGQPAIVFGDHTRCIKYIDFPFCMGADGVKVLRPRIEAELKYLYYFLKSLDIPSAGYDRHYKYLKRTEVVLPPLPEQRRIAAILDQVDALRAKRREALAELDRLTQSIFIEMFGDPATNPRQWPIGRIADLIESACYGTSEKSASAGEFPVLRMNNLTRSGELDLRDLKYMELPEGLRSKYLVRAGDVLFNRTNSAELVGKTAMVPPEAPPLAYAGYLIRLRVNAENSPTYLSRFLNTAYAKLMLRGMCKSIIGMANINATEIQAMKIALPPLALQQTFATRIQAVESLKATHRAALAELDALFASLQHRAFAGTL